MIRPMNGGLGTRRVIVFITTAQVTVLEGLPDLFPVRISVGIPDRDHVRAAAGRRALRDGSWHGGGRDRGGGCSGGGGSCSGGGGGAAWGWCIATSGKQHGGSTYSAEGVQESTTGKYIPVCHPRPPSDSTCAVRPSRARQDVILVSN